MLGAAAAVEPGGLSPRLSSRRDSVPEAAWRQGLRPEEPPRGVTPRSSRRKDPVLQLDLRGGTTTLLAGGRGRLGKAASQPVLRTVAVKPQRPAPPLRELPDLLGDDAAPATGRETSRRPLSAADAGDESNGARLGCSGARRGQPRRYSQTPHAWPVHFAAMPPALGLGSPPSTDETELSTICRSPDYRSFYSRFGVRASSLARALVTAIRFSHSYRTMRSPSKDERPSSGRGIFLRNCADRHITPEPIGLHRAASADEWNFRYGGGHHARVAPAVYPSPRSPPAATSLWATGWQPLRPPACPPWSTCAA